MEKPTLFPDFCVFLMVLIPISVLEFTAEIWAEGGNPVFKKVHFVGLSLAMREMY